MSTALTIYFSVNLAPMVTSENESPYNLKIVTISKYSTTNVF